MKHIETSLRNERVHRNNETFPRQERRRGGHDSNSHHQEGENQTKISNNLDKFNEILNKINSNSSNVDKQLSNFLCSQLNTQSSLINLTEALSKNGLLEAKKVKEYFQKIEKELKKIKK